MTATEQDLLAALRELDERIAATRAGKAKPDLQPVFQKIDSLTQQLPKSTDPMLLHYLYRKSYEKARLWLEGRGTDTRT